MPVQQIVVVKWLDPRKCGTGVSKTYLHAIGLAIRGHPDISRRHARQSIIESNPGALPSFGQTTSGEMETVSRNDGRQHRMVRDKERTQIPRGSQIVSSWSKNLYAYIHSCDRCIWMRRYAHSNETSGRPTQWGENPFLR